jgi:GNAT superfamily N-acetyltransferase
MTSVRLATFDDIADVARLLGQLGYPDDDATFAARWPAWQAEGNRALVALDADGRIIGLLTTHVMTVLHRPAPVGRISAMVVQEGLRGSGVGRALVRAAEALLHDAGCGLVEVTSNLRRTDAHAFYERIGYERTSYRFMRPL